MATPEEAQERTLELLEQIVDALDLDAEIEVVINDDAVTGTLEEMTSGSSSVSTARRSTLCSILRRGSSSATPQMASGSVLRSMLPATATGAVNNSKGRPKRPLRRL